MTNKLKIDQVPDPDYEVVTISNLGFVDPYGNEGLVVLTSPDKKEFYMRAFSGEVSRHIASFLDGDHDSIPTIYKMLEDICEANELLLVKVKIYESGDALRAVTLAVYYNIPIMVRKNMLQDPIENSTESSKANRNLENHTTSSALYDDNDP